MALKLGRLPRAHDPAIPHLSAWLGSVVPPPIPPALSYTTRMPPNFGMMVNDQLGDCTCAAYYHAMQVWSFNATGIEETAPDSEVVRLYELTCGYIPGDPTTDNGGQEQTVLRYIHRQGVPAVGNHKLYAFFEVDPRNREDVKRVIAECGVAYIGFMVPSNVMPEQGMPQPLWEYDPLATPLGGHAVVLVGYDPEWATFISWGQLFRMSWEFFEAYTEEAYALCDSAWITASGKSPFGMTLNDLTRQMQALAAVSRLRALHLS